MVSKYKAGAGTIAVDDHGSLSTPQSEPVTSFYIEKQTRTRRLFSTKQLFFFSFLYFSTWSGMGAQMYFALLNGGPAALLFNFIIAFIGGLSQALAVAELASILPLAGAQYYWTYHFAPPRCRRLLAWLSGWTTWLGFVSGLAGVANSMAVAIETGVILNFPEYQSGGYKSTLIIIAYLAAMTALNSWGFKAVPWIDLGVGLLNIVFFVIVMVVLWVMSPKNDPSFIMTTASYSGWGEGYISWNVGMVTQVWMFIGFENVVHMGEETRNAKKSTPQAMVFAHVFSGLLGFLMTITLIICMPPLDDLLQAPYPFYYMLETNTGSKTITTVIATFLIIIGTTCGLSSFTSTSRMTWAWARDGAFPAFFGHVDKTEHVPLRAVMLTCSIVTLLALFNLSSGTFVALGAIISLASLAMYFSYLIVLAVALHARLTTGLPKAQWTVGRAGLPVNIFALVYTLYVMVWLPFPTTVPVDASTMNYCGPIFLAVMLGAMGAWFLWAEKNWKGPNKDLAEYVLRSEDKE